MQKIWLAILLLISFVAAAQPGQNPFLDSLKNEKDQALFQKKIEKYRSGTEQEMRAVYEYYAIDRPKGDSLRRLIAARYPLGYTSFLLWRDRVYAEKDPGKREEMFFQLKKDFPDQNFDAILNHVITGYAEAKNIAKTNEYLAQLSNSGMKDYIIQSVVEVIGKYDLPSAKAIVKQEMDKIEKTSRSYVSYSTIYATMLLKEENYKEALKYAKEAYDNAEKKTTPLQTNYGLLLSKTGQHAAALPILQELVRTGFATAEIKLAFKESYMKLNPGKDAVAALTELEGVVYAKYREEVAKQIINESSPNFELKDIDGKVVTLADFKGKTIVLDFWATWCAPCKRSFPAMQMAVNKYKKDPNVKFLFIHTRETAKDPLTDAKTYLSSNNYTFDLYMDYKDPKTNSSPAAAALKVVGIPAKFVIDGSGNIRFKLTGFYGGDDDAVAELSAMIDMAKK